MTIQAREMAARLARIEDAMTTLPARLRDIRQRYEVAADSYRMLKALIILLPASPARETLVLYADVVLRNIYALADVLSTLTKLELAASDYAVLMALLRGMVADDTPEVVTVQVFPVREEKSA